MAKHEDIAARLREIRRLADEALVAIGRRTESRREVKSDHRTTRTSRKALPDHILVLREENFFCQPRCAPEIHKKLQNKYPSDLNRVAVALLRLHKRRLLRRTSTGTGKNRQVAYVW